MSATKWITSKDPKRLAAMLEGARLYRESRPPELRLWEKVDKSGGPDACWPWTGGVQANGYGRISLSTKPRRDPLVHRFAWELSGRKLPEWPMVIDHICKNRRCCNVAHMRVVSQRQNSVENSDSPMAANARKTHCKRGHEFTPENTATRRLPGKVSPNGWRIGSTYQRICLTCFPTAWRHAVIPRDPPPGARLKPHEKQQFARRASGE